MYKVVNLFMELPNVDTYMITLILKCLRKSIINKPNQLIKELAYKIRIIKFIKFLNRIRIKELNIGGEYMNN